MYFIVSLAYIAFLTAVIGDMAEIFGCVLEIPDLVTGITFVALGTSMPDLFASRHFAAISCGFLAEKASLIRKA